MNTSSLRLGETGSPDGSEGGCDTAGWGAEMGYPAIVLDERADPVLGHIFVSEKLADHWRELDEFEGEQYGRATTTVHLADQRTVKAFIYVLREGV